MKIFLIYLKSIFTFYFFHSVYMFYNNRFNISSPSILPYTNKPQFRANIFTIWAVHQLNYNLNLN